MLAAVGIKGKKQGKNGSTMRGPLAASNPQFPMMPIHNILADPQAQAGSTDIFRSEESLKDSLQGLPIYSVASICNRN
jgi:hypothetical protein